MDWHSLELLEFDRVIASVAAHAASETARAALLAARPIADPALRRDEIAALAEAIRRQREPEAWSAVGRGSMREALDPDARGALDGETLLGVLGWLEAARETRGAWSSDDSRGRHPRLAARVDALPALDALRERLAKTLDEDGRVRDDASPELRRARAEVLRGERRLHQQLERWAAGFGETAYVTRHADRFVVLVPAAGFSRKRGIVHDVSNSGQSLFVEPLEACEANNELMEYRAVAAEEERRILLELGNEVARERDALTALEDGLAALDALRARAVWATAHGGQAIEPSPGPLRLVRARHPLLAIGARRESIVPLDLELAEDGRLLLVSGPNMGGKTVLLKTVGLSVALAHAAFPVLADEGSRLPEIDDVRADLGDEQSVDQGLSTFAAHLRALAGMAAAAGPRTLLLADELGAGTDPEEGAALGRALVEHFAARGAWGVMTTHLGSLKRVASEVPGVVNGSLEFDLDTLTSLYRFVPGLPGASHALDVAGRLGFPREILERAKTLTPDESRALERLLAEIADARRQMDETRAAMEAARAEAQRAASEHRTATENARKAVEELRRRLTSEADALLGRARELWQTVQRDARRADKTREGAARLKLEMDAIDRGSLALHGAADPAAFGPPEPEVSREPMRLVAGERVRVLDLGIEAEVAGPPDADGRVTLRRGSWSIQSHTSRLAPARASSDAPPARPVASYVRAEETLPLEADLRGMEVDAAISEVDQALDRAILAGLSEVRIIHGIGRGILRAAVERHLRGHPQVQGQRLGLGHEGGRGVTVAQLRG